MGKTLATMFAAALSASLTLGCGDPPVAGDAFDFAQADALWQALAQEVDVDVQDEPLEKILRDWSAKYGVTIELIGQGEAPDDFAHKLTLRLKATPLAIAIETAVAQADLQWESGSGVVRVGLSDSLERAVITRVYPLPPGLQWPADDPKENFPSLADVIKQTIARETWEADSGAAYIRELPGGLVVVNTPAVQETIARLIRTLDEHRSHVGSTEPVPITPRYFRYDSNEPPPQIWFFPIADLLTAMGEPYQADRLTHQQLIDLLVSVIGDDRIRNGYPDTAIESVPGGLIVAEKAGILDEIARTLATLRQFYAPRLPLAESPIAPVFELPSAKPPPTAEDERIRKTLAKRIDFDAGGHTATTLCAWLKRQGIPTRLRAIDVWDVHKPLEGKIVNTPLGDSLQELLGSVGMSYSVERGELVIDSKQSADAQTAEPRKPDAELITLLYAVGDLFPLELASNGDFNNLISDLANSESAALAADPRFIPGGLIVSADLKFHRIIATILAAIRHGRDPRRYPAPSPDVAATDSDDEFALGFLYLTSLRGIDEPYAADALYGMIDGVLPELFGGENSFVRVIHKTVVFHLSKAQHAKLTEFFGPGGENLRSLEPLLTKKLSLRDVPELTAAVKHDDWKVRVAAISRLSQLIGQPEYTASVQMRRRTENRDRLRPILQTIAGAIEDGDLRVARPACNCAWAIDKSDEEKSFLVPAFAKAIERGDWALRQAAWARLSDLGEPLDIPVSALLVILNDIRLSDETRVAACKWLGKKGPTAAKAVEPMFAFLDKRLSSQEHRAAVGEALAAIGMKAVLPVLAKRLADKELEVRLAAVQTAAAMGPVADEALPDILNMWLSFYVQRPEIDYATAGRVVNHVPLKIARHVLAIDPRGVAARRWIEPRLKDADPRIQRAAKLALSGLDRALLAEDEKAP